MATTIIGSVRQLIHDASDAVIENGITGKISDLATSTVKTGVQIMDDVLVIVRDMTKEDGPEGAE